MTEMCTYFETETDVAQNLIDIFFFTNFYCQTTFSIGKILNKKMRVRG